MLPNLATFDEADKRPAYVVSRCNLTMGSGRIANAQNSKIGKLGRRTSLAARFYGVNFSARITPLGDHVRHVVGLGAEKQMVRVDAQANVALVADEQTWRDWPVGYFPSGAMCVSLNAAIPQYAIAIFPNGACPQHASAFIRRRRVMHHSLFKCPMTRRVESLRDVVSHVPAPIQRRVVRAGLVLDARARSAFLARRRA